MKRLWCLLCFSLAACGPSETKEVDNSATRYADGLVSDVEKAKAAAEKANRAVAQTEATQRDAFEQTD